MKFSGVLTVLILIIHLPQQTKPAADRSGLSDLLMPQMYSQITLRIPEYYYVMVPELPPVLVFAIDFLVSEKVPFRIFYNFTQIEVRPSVPRTPRFTRNYAVWLVFVSVQSESEGLDLYEVFKSCTLGTAFGHSATIHNDFIQLIVDESAVAEPWDETCDFNIIRSYFPLYFVLLSWSGTDLQSQDALLLREKCGCDDGSGFTTLRHFIPTLKESNGMEIILKRIRSEKMDFRGRHVTMHPRQQVKGSWESTWRNFFHSFSFRAAHKHHTLAFVGLFDALISQHNFTLDFESDSRSFGLDRNKAEVHMDCSVGCDRPWQHCYNPPVSLSESKYHNTLFFEKPVSVDSFSLPSFAAPLSDSMVAITLLGTSLFVALILTGLTSKPCEIVPVCLSIYLGLIGKSLPISGNRKSAYLYSFWLLLTRVLSATYTNILQSYVVVPQVRYNDLSFEQMTKKNYSFESTLWLWMKILTSTAFECRGTREEMLSERVSKIGKSLGIGTNLDEFVHYYSGSTKRVLVEHGSDTKVYKLISKVTGWDLTVGKERFFNVPLWWNFVRVERASLLASSVELLKEAGLLQYFLRLSDLKFREAVIAAGRDKEFTTANVSTSMIHRTEAEGSSASLNDGLVRECFVLFMYGILTAVAIFLAEQLTKVVHVWLHPS